jgi:hypothetical protein
MIPSVPHSSISAGRRARRGAALPLALLLLVVMSVVSAGAFVAARQTFRGGRNAVVEQRAFGVAEFGMNQEVARWDTRRNLPVSKGGMAIGGVDSTPVYVAAGDSARMRITRLSDMIYWVESVGRASIPNPALTSVRSVGALHRLAYPTITPRGAVTTAGNIRLQGSATVDGRDNVPAQWTAAECADMRGPDLYAIAAPPGATVQYQAGNITSPLSVLYDPVAGDSNTYVRYGTESWNSLAAAANVKLLGGQYGTDILPSDSSGVCLTSSMMNWGEPFRGGSDYVAACTAYFPIIYVNGDLQLNGKGRGQGILLVNGNLRINGTFDFDGLIVVRDDIDKGNGSATITGAVMARNATFADGGSWINGNQTVSYSKCAVESALRGSAILVRVRDRSWMQVY